MSLRHRVWPSWISVQLAGRVCVKSLNGGGEASTTEGCRGQSTVLILIACPPTDALVKNQ
jgi:hypothetical protein